MNKGKEIITLMVSLLLTSCQLQIPTVDIQCQSTTSSSDTQKPLADQRSDKINLEIQVDGTESMQGFVKNARKSRYEQTLELLDVIATASWSEEKSTIKYYRFGLESREIPKSDYITAQKPDFYGLGGIFRDGQVIKAITSAAPNKLSIIVTDLYQTDADISSVIGKLKTDYLQKGYAVGILGIKSEFKGTVYDIGVRKITRDYNTDGKKLEQFRPFYLLLLGSHENVAYYFQKLQQQSGNLITSDQFIIFYPRVIKSSSTLNLDQFPVSLPQGQNDLRKIATFNNGQVRGKIVDKSSTLALMITEKADQTYEFSQTIAYYPSLYTLPVDISQPDAFIPQINGKIFSPETQKFKPDSSQGLQFKGWKIEGQESEYKLSFETSIDSQKIQPAIYTFQVNLIPNRLKNPDWWKTWNFDESSFDRTNVTNFEGDTTLNLLNFMNGMKSITSDLVKSKSPAAGNLCYGIQRD